MRRPIWHLALAAILGAAIGSASMASYLYLFQLKVEDNAAQIERLEKRTERLERKPAAKPTIKRPTYTPSKREWWQWWKK